MLASGKISTGQRSHKPQSHTPTTPRTVQLSLNGPKTQPSHTHIHAHSGSSSLHKKTRCNESYFFWGKWAFLTNVKSERER